MPELPEMETYRRHLESRCSGRRVVLAEVNRRQSLNLPAGEFRRAVEGSVLAAFGRAGKHLIFRLSTGQNLLNHLMLGGAIFHGTDAEAPQRTFQVILRLDDGTALWWTGLRLGWLHLLSQAELAARTADLGLDPLDPGFSAGHMAELLQGRRGTLKPLLVNQRYFPGIGNCYSDELCWAARVHPLRVARTLGAGEVERLWQAMRSTLAEAVARGGYTETPFFAGDTVTGGYLPHLKVYDRKGEACFRCGGPVAFVEASGRKVFFCPVCQPTDQSERRPDANQTATHLGIGGSDRPGVSPNL
jgi:formamidopyrimidine-DNA glycosylase